MSEQFTYEADADETSSPGALVARGDNFLDEEEDAGLPSELDGVSDECWTQFVKALMTAKVSSVSPSNAVGVFEMMPRRLADLGLVRRLARSKSPENRVVYVALFVPPMTADKFLKSPQVQYRAFCASMKDYDGKMKSGEITREPQMSRSGALALLHRAGPKALDNWSRGDKFENTKKLYDKVAGLF